MNEWRVEAVLEPYVQIRMRQLGAKPRQIGIVDDVETGVAFSLEHDMGGRNSRPAWSGADKGGINVDYAIFNPDFLPFESWRSASLRDRIDAIIIHELTEYKGRAKTTALRHRKAILRSPETTADITPNARSILKDYRLWFLQQGR